MKQPIKIFLLLFFVFIGTEELMAQYKLVLSEVQIRTKETGKFEKFADKVANMTSDMPIRILIYKNSDVSYYACFHLTERGRRFRLINHDYLIHNDDPIKGEPQKIKYKHTEGVKGRIAGVSEQNITFNPGLNYGIQVVYRFDLLLD
jgi:hypothetical protein